LNQAERKHHAELATWLAANGPLRDGMGVEDAATIVWTIARRCTAC
jgi:hypothetical protein